MSNTRAIIIAAGDGTRWDNYLGVPKHFAEVEGVPIIERTIALCNEFGIDETYVVGRDDRYDLPDSKLYMPHPMPYAADAAKFLDSKDLWLRAQDARTFVLYGDVYFTHNTFQMMMDEQRRDFFLFARGFPSSFTGNTSGECFAQTFWGNVIDMHERKLDQLVEAYHKNEIHRIGGWEHYRLIEDLDSYTRPDPIDTGAGIDPRTDKPYPFLYSMHQRHFVGGGAYRHVDDFTEDFDLPEDYDNFIAHYEIAKTEMPERYWI